MDNNTPNGKVILAGAGPGDPGLICVKAMEALAKADTILYDNLANSVLLQVCRPEAEKIFVGKKAGRHFVKQDETIAILIEKAKEGRYVVRLKGGDPLIFGRGSEEALALKAEGIEYEFIPGITSAAGASMYAGIPMTHRNMVTQCLIVTAHESPDKDSSQVDWELLAKMKHTNMFIYMGVARLPRITQTLIEAGMPGDTAAALIQNGTLPTQRTITGTIATIAEQAKENNVKPPVIFMIGPTVALRNELHWIEDKPLFGKRIVTTRAVDQSASLHNYLAEAGAHVLPCQSIRTDMNDISDWITNMLDIREYDWVFFTSENGVRYFFSQLQQQGVDSRILAGKKVAAIGTSTGARLKEYGILADYIPSKFTSASLLEEMPETVDIKGLKVLRVKGDFKKDTLTEGLADMGAKVDTVDVYGIFRDGPEEAIKQDIMDNGADAYLFTSISTVKNFAANFGNEKALELLHNSMPIAIGPVTGRALKELDVNKHYESPVHTVPGMMQYLEELLTHGEQ